jgi:hypothetical protein
MSPYFLLISYLLFFLPFNSLSSLGLGVCKPSGEKKGKRKKEGEEQFFIYFLWKLHWFWSNFDLT